MEGQTYGEVDGDVDADTNLSSSTSFDGLCHGHAGVNESEYYWYDELHVCW